MENAIAAGLSKQLVLGRAMEVNANNIANQTTAGFKADRVLFREYLTTIDSNTANDPEVSLVFDPDAYTDFSQGGLDATYGTLDFAIDGVGFFAVEEANGQAYTRDGRFSVNGFGELVNRDGARVLDESGSPIFIDPDAGPILVTDSGDLQQANASIGQIGVFQFEERQALRKSGNGLFTTEATPEAVQNPRIKQGFVETSNVAPIVAVTNMIEIMRAYEQAARVVEMSDELARSAISTLSETA